MSELETGACHGFIEWLFIIAATIIIIIIEIIEELPGLITLTVYVSVTLGYILFSCYILIFSFSPDKHVKALLNYRMEFEFVGIHILWPPVWCFYVVLGPCIIFLWSYVEWV